MSEKIKRTVRTVIQSALGLAAGLPLIVSASGIPARAAGVAVVLAVAAAFTRIMAVPEVDQLLARVGLGVNVPAASAPAAAPGSTPEPPKAA